MHDGSYNAGLKAFLAGDVATALAFWRPLAEAGHPRAIWRLGSMYATGQGLPHDPAAAVRWYERAAGLGCPEAMAAFGAMLIHGIGVPQDHRRAYLWLNLAVACGESESIGLRDRAAASLSSDQIAEVDQECRTRFRSLAPAVEP